MATAQSAHAGKAGAESVGAIIRSIRQGLDLTQAQLAGTEFSVSYISAVERGRIYPSLKAIFLLAEHLGVPPGFLLEARPAGFGTGRDAVYSAADALEYFQTDLTLLHTEILYLQQGLVQAEALLASLEARCMSIQHKYVMFLLRGQVLLEKNAYHAAAACFWDAIWQAEAMSDGEDAARARNLLGLAYALSGDYALALQHHLQCAAVYDLKTFPDPFFALEVFANLASDYFSLGQDEQAATLYQNALEFTGWVTRQYQNQVFIVVTTAQEYLDISLRYMQAGKWAMAREFATRARALVKMRAEHASVGLIHQRLAKVRERQGDFEQAHIEYQRALNLAHALKNEAVASLCHSGLAELALAQRDLEAAMSHGKKAIALARSGNDQQTLAHALQILGSAYHATREYRRADALYTQAIELLANVNAHDLAARAASRYARLLEERKETTRSLKAWKRAFELHKLSAVA